MIRFKCPQCGGSLETPGSHRGEEINCLFAAASTAAPNRHRQTKGRATARSYLTYRATPRLYLFLLSFLPLTLSGCTSQKAIEKARQRGAQAGREEGRHSGEADGFTTAFKAAKNEAYRETLTELQRSGEYRRIPFFTVAIVGSFFILGYLLQWTVVYVLRYKGYLRDIDWIVLPKEMTQIDFANMTASSKSNHKQLLENVRSAKTTLIILILLGMTGCKNAEEKAWQEGYEANRSWAYHDGWQKGEARGKKEGEEQGRLLAQNAAQTGRAWKLYSKAGFLALVFGVIVGIEARMRSKESSNPESAPFNSELVPNPFEQAERCLAEPTASPITVPLPDTDAPRGIVMQWKRNQIDRQTAIKAIQEQYNAQLDALGYHLRKAVSVSNARADRIAEEYLKKLDSEHIQILKDLGLRNAETRARALIEVREMIAVKLQEVQSKKWPQSLKDRTVDDLLDLEKRVSAEMMKELGT